jgi:hypothetical protein
MTARNYRRLGARVLIGATILALGACGTVQAGSAGSRAASGPRATSDSATPFAGTADAAASFTGPAGWRVIAGSNRFEVTADGGRAWRQDSLPAAIPVADVRDISSAPGAATVVAAVVRATVKVAAQARPGASWSVTTVKTAWPREYRLVGPPGFVSLTQAPHGFVGLVAGLSMGMSTELVDFFTSTNGGASFTKALSQNSLVWRGTAFRTARNGIAVEGPAGTFLDCTTDGGTRWTQSAIPAGLKGAVFSNPLVVAGDFLVAATRQASSGEQHVVVLRSSDGRSFAPVGKPLVIPAKYNGGNVITAAVAGHLWIFAGALFTSADSGQHWTRAQTSGLPKGVISASLASPTTGSAVVETNSCMAYKSDCTSSEHTFITRDAGRTWARQ